MKNKPKINFKGNFLILLLLTIMIMFFSLKDDFNDIVKLLFKINPFWLVLAIILVLGYWGFRAISIYIFVNKFNKNYKLNEAMELTVATQFFNAITPFASGGQPFQVYMLTKKKLKVNESLSVVAVNFICYQIALVLIGLLAIISNNIFNILDKNSLLQKFVTIGFIVNISIALVTLLLVFSKKINKKVAKICVLLLNKVNIVKNKDEVIKKINDKLSEFNKSGKILINYKKDFVLSIIYNIISITCLYIVPLAIIVGFGIAKSINVFETIICSAYTMLIGSFVPLPGGTGGVEYGFINFFGNFLNGAILKTLMLLWRFFTYYFGMFIGAITFNIMERRK